MPIVTLVSAGMVREKLPSGDDLTPLLLPIIDIEAFSSGSFLAFFSLPETVAVCETPTTGIANNKKIYIRCLKLNLFLCLCFFLRKQNYIKNYNAN